MPQIIKHKSLIKLFIDIITLIFIALILIGKIFKMKKLSGNIFKSDGRMVTKGSSGEAWSHGRPKSL